MEKGKKILCTVLVICAALLLLIPFFYTVVLSATDFSILRGLLGSAWVGLDNLRAVFTAPYFADILTNTATISVLGLLIGAVYVFVSSLAIGSAKNAIFKGVLAVAFCLPAVIPVNLFITLIPRDLLSTPSFLLQLIVAAEDGLRLSGLVVIAALFIKENVLHESFKCALLFAAIRLLCFFTSDGTFLQSVYNPSVYEVLDTLSTYPYRTGFLVGDYSLASAAHMARVLLQLIPAVGACVVLINVFKEKPATGSRSGSCLPCAAFAIVPLALLAAVIVAGGSLFPDGAETLIAGGYGNGLLIARGYGNGLFIAILSALWVTLLSAFMAILARNAGVLGILVLSVLCLTGNNVIGGYFIIRSLGLVNTPWGAVLQNLSMVSVLSLVFTFITRSNRSIIKDLSVFMVGFAVMFAWFWGDTMAPMMVLVQRDLYPLSLIIREVIQGPGINGQPLSTLPYILTPLLVSAAGMIVGALLTRTRRTASTPPPAGDTFSPGN